MHIFFSLVDICFLIFIIRSSCKFSWILLQIHFTENISLTRRYIFVYQVINHGMKHIRHVAMVRIYGATVDIGGGSDPC
jgi:hypothetical protein